MMSILVSVLIIAGLSAVFCGMYYSGHMSIGMKRAMVFVGYKNLKNREFRANFKRCSGSVKRVLWVQEEKLYRVRFHVHLKKGNVSVKVQDKDRNTLFVLDEEHYADLFDSSRGRMYYLTFVFKNADGDFWMNWD